jgi:GNAT superfamily N-acetyltransferase
MLFQQLRKRPKAFTPNACSEMIYFYPGICYALIMTYIFQKATAADAAKLAPVHISGWRSSYEGMASDEFLNSQSESEMAAKWESWLASEDSFVIHATDETGELVGFISYGRLRTPPPGMSQIRPLYTSEIYAIYILPNHWRQKLGSQLFTHALTDLREKKHRSVCLWVMEGNKRAVSFYKAKGGQKCGTNKVDIGGKLLNDIAYGWRDFTSLL